MFSYPTPSVRGAKSADDADDDGAERRPPHPVDGQVLERVFDGVESARDEDRDDADRRA